MFKYSCKVLYSIHPPFQHPSSHSAIWIISFPDYLNNLSPDSKEYEDTQGKPAEAIYRSILLVPECGQMSVVIFVCLSVPAAAALVVVSEVSDEANDNLKQGVGFHWTRSNTDVSTARCVIRDKRDQTWGFPVVNTLLNLVYLAFMAHLLTQGKVRMMLSRSRVSNSHSAL